jgi:hypothetical protein
LTNSVTQSALRYLTLFGARLAIGNLGRYIEGRRPRTWVEITRLGRGALAAEMDALKQLVQRHQRRHLRPARPS